MLTAPISHDRTTTVLRWAARVWSLFLLGLVIFTLFNTGPEGIYGLQAVMYIPLGLTALATIGLLLAFKWEKAGGVLALASILAAVVGIVILNPDNTGATVNTVLFWGVPAVVFIWCARRAEHY